MRRITGGAALTANELWQCGATGLQYGPSGDDLAAEANDEAECRLYREIAGLPLAPEPRIVVEVRGGVVVGLYQRGIGEDTELWVVDWDDQGDGIFVRQECWDDKVPEETEAAIQRHCEEGDADASAPNPPVRYQVRHVAMESRRLGLDGAGVLVWSVSERDWLTYDTPEAAAAAISELGAEGMHGYAVPAEEADD